MSIPHNSDFHHGLLSCLLAALGLVWVLAPSTSTVHVQSTAEFVPVTDAMLQDPAPGDWLMWRRTLDGWGYSPLDQITRDNVGQLRLVWTRGMAPGSQQATPLTYGGVMYLPNPRDIIQAIDAASGDLIWEHRRDVPEGIEAFLLGTVSHVNRNIAIYDNLIIDTSVDDHVFALDVATGDQVWETQILDYKVNPPPRPPDRSSPTVR